MTTLYEVNDLISISTNIELPVPGYYERPAGHNGEDSDTDIVFQSGGVSVSSDQRSTRRIGSRYQWDSDTKTLFLNWNFPLDLRCTVTGLGHPQKQTVVEMTDQYLKRGEIRSLFWSVLNVELLARDYTILHGGCLSRGESGGALITGWDDMGKTSTCLSTHDRAEYSFMGDDAIIIGSEGDAHAWDQEVGISPYTATGNIPIPSAKLRRIKLKRLSKKVPGLGVLHSSRERVDIENTIRSNTSRCEPERVFFLEGGDNGTNSIDQNEASRRMLETSTADKRLIKHDLIRTYAYLHPPISNLHAKRREVFESAAENLEAVELRSEDKDRYTDWIVSYEE